MAINKTDLLQFEDEFYQIIPPAPSETERGGIIASPRTSADTVEARLGDDGKLYVRASEVDLSNYYDKSEVDEVVANKADADHNHDDVYYTESEVDTKLSEVQAYAESVATNAANTVKNDLLNGAGDAYDTLSELGDLINENTSTIDTLREIATGKADAEHTHSYNDLTDKIVGEEESLITIITDYDCSAISTEVSNYLVAGEKYKVIFNDAEYETIAYEAEYGNQYNNKTTKSVILGNYMIGVDNAIKIFKGAPEAVENALDFPFQMSTGTSSNGNEIKLYINVSDDAPYNSIVSLYHYSTVIRVLDEIYIPETIARTAYVDEALSNKASVNHDHNDIYYTESEIDSKVDEINVKINALETVSATHALKSDVETVNDNLTTLQGKVDSVESELDVLAILAQANEAAIKSLQTAVETQTEEISEVSDRVTELETWHANFVECTEDDVNQLFV